MFLLNKITRKKIEVVGLKYYEYENIRTNIKLNDRIYLEKEPDNKYDKKAIKVYSEVNNKRFHIGYISKTTYDSLNVKDCYRIVYISSYSLGARLYNEEVKQYVL